MSVVRRFLVASSLVRLIRKERGGSRITEGYFAPQAGRTSYVRVDGQNCHLVLVTTAADGVASEERTDVPRAHGDALLDVCSGKAAYDRAVVALGNGREALVDRYVTPGTLDLLSVTFDEPGQAGAFTPPAWFGDEVSGDSAYDRHALAIQGVPQPRDVSLTNGALDGLLDLLEPRFGFGRFNAPPPAPKPGEDEATLRARRRAAALAAKAAEPAVEPVAAPVEEPAPQPVVEERSEERQDEPAAEPAPTAETQHRPDARIDDVIESLSQALGASQQPRPPARDDDPAAEFERWTVRPRRNQQT